MLPDKSISLETNKGARISYACYGCQVGLLKREEQRKLSHLETDYLRNQLAYPDYKKSRTRSKLHAEKSNLGIIQRWQLKWYGHLLRMEDSLWPKKIYKWTPHGRRRRESPQ